MSCSVLQNTCLIPGKGKMLRVRLREVSTMGQKQVTVNDDNTKLQITVGPPSGLVHTVNIDLTDVKNIVEGIVEVLRLSETHTNARINLLMQKLESLEKRALSDDDIRRIAHILKTQSGELRADGRPTNDTILANKLESMLKS